MFKQLKKDALGENLDYVRHLARALRSNGFQLGDAKPQGAFDVSGRYVALAAMGVIAGGVLLLTWFVPLGATVQLSTIAIGMAIATGLIVLARHTTDGERNLKGLAVIAFLSSIILPCLALVRCGVTELVFIPLSPTDPRSDKNAWKLKAASVFLRASGWSALGGLFVATLLGDWAFMTESEQFIGVKVSQAVPVLFALVLFIGLTQAQDLGVGKTPRERRTDIMRGLSHLLSQPLQVWVALAGAAALGLLAFWLLRTGNQPGVGVSTFELKFRSLLEQWLGARPRTKEFAFGHPAMILAVLFAMRGKRVWAGWCAVAAAIGQASIVNTFCHLHTPIQTALLRSCNGLWLGLLIGIAVGMALDRRATEARRMQRDDSVLIVSRSL